MGPQVRGGPPEGCPTLNQASAELRKGGPIPTSPSCSKYWCMLHKQTTDSSSIKMKESYGSGSEKKEEKRARGENKARQW